MDRRHTVSESSGVRRLTIVHFGNYFEAYGVLKVVGQKIIMPKNTRRLLASLAARSDVESVTSVSLSLDLPDTVLPNSIRTLGIELYSGGRRARHTDLIEVVRQTKPTHLVVMTPNIPLIRWAIGEEIPVLPMFADSFRASGLKAKLHSKLLAFVLNNRSIDLVANHSIAASLDLKRIGVDPHKIVPFDWPALAVPSSFEPKAAPLPNQPFRLLYVGTLLETKGVGDAIVAISKLRQRGSRVELTIIGRGDSEVFEKLGSAETNSTSMWHSWVPKVMLKCSRQCAITMPY